MVARLKKYLKKSNKLILTTSDTPNLQIKLYNGCRMCIYVHFCIVGVGIYWE